MKSVTSSNQTTDRNAGTVRDTANAPENAGKGAAIAISPAPPANVPPEKAAPPASPGKTLSESDRQTLRRAFHLLLAKRRSSIAQEQETLFNDMEIYRKRGTVTEASKTVCMAEYGRLKSENNILSMLEKGVSPDAVMLTSFLTDGETKPEWESYLCLLGELYSMFATPEEMEA